MIDYKKQERTKELAAMEEKLADRSAEFNTLAKRINNLEDGEQSYQDVEEKLAHDPEYQPPEPQGFMSAKSYKAKFAEPLVKRLKKLVKSLLVRYFKVQDNYYRLNKTNGELYRDNEELARSNDRLKEENTVLREQNKDYSLLRKVFGNKQIDDLVGQATKECVLNLGIIGIIYVHISICRQMGRVIVSAEFTFEKSTVKSVSLR